MPDPTELVSAVVVSAGVTWLLRALPFVVLAPLRRSAVVSFLAARMPIGVMTILVLYTLRDLPGAGAGQVAPVLVSVVVTIGLQVWRRNVLLSIIVGTLVCVGLSSAVSL